MVDPISDVGDVDEDEAPECVVCGAKIVNDRNHRVVTWVEDGLIVHKDFCSPACKAEWFDEGEQEE